MFFAFWIEGTPSANYHRATLRDISTQMASFNEGAGSGCAKPEKNDARMPRGNVLVEPNGAVEGQGLGPSLDDLVRYRDPESGRTWCGYGRPPNWIRGKDRERFRVQQSARELS